MSKRLQVLMKDEELRQLRQIAGRHRMTVAEWVRQAIRQASRRESTKDPSRKRAALRAAAKLAFPIGDIKDVLREIEQGYLPPDEP